MEEGKLENQATTWPDGPGYFSKTNVESIVREAEYTQRELMNQQGVMIRYPQEVNKDYKS